MKKTTTGFTIVELLIVIVVIAILAAISFVAYTNIQDRTHDSVVQNDISNFATKIRLYEAEKGSLPVGGQVSSSEGSSTGSVQTAPSGITFSVSRGSYTEPTSGGAANFIYCTGPVLGGSGEAGFAIYTKSKSQKRIRYSSMNGIVVSTGGDLVIQDACAGIDYPRSYSYGYFFNSGGWQSWSL